MVKAVLIGCAFVASMGVHDVAAKNASPEHIPVHERIGKEVSAAITSFWNGANPKSGQNVVVRVGKERLRVDVIDTWLEQMTCITCLVMDVPLFPNPLVYHKERRIVRVPRRISDQKFFSLIQKRTEAYVRERMMRGAQKVGTVHHIVIKRVDRRKATVYVLHDMRPETQLDKAFVYAKYAAIGGASLNLFLVLSKFNVRQLLIALAAVGGTVTSPYPEWLRIMGQLDFE